MAREPKEPADSLGLAGTVPADATNGLKAILPELIEEGAAVRHQAVVEYIARHDKRDRVNGTHQIVVEFTWIEPVSGANAKVVKTLLSEAQGERLGMLPTESAEATA